mgnify:CR=1 FL=1
MKKMFKNSIAIFLIAITLVSCRLSTNELAEEVQKSMLEKFKSEGAADIKVKSFMLTEKGNNEYAGILETTEPNGEFTYKIKVIYDGENFTWEIVQ